MSIFDKQKHLILEIEPRDFLKILAIRASYSYKLFLTKNGAHRFRIQRHREARLSSGGNTGFTNVLDTRTQNDSSHF